MSFATWWTDHNLYLRAIPRKAACEQAYAAGAEAQREADTKIARYHSFRHIEHKESCEEAIADAIRTAPLVSEER